MKRFIIVFVIFIVACMPVYAEGSGTEYYNKAENLISEYGIELDKIREYPFQTLWDAAKEALKKGVTSPLKIFYKITAVLLLTSFIGFFASGQSKQIVNIINIVTILVLFTSVYDSFQMLIDNITDGFIDIKNFMTAFIPSFATMAFASGEMITSTVYTGFFMVCVITVANFCITYIIPSVSLFMALGITSSVSHIINLRPLCDLYSKSVKVAMTAVVSVLCFVLTLQTAITQSQDSLAVKTGKAIIGSAVPIIGSALQSAVGSVYASLGVLKGFFGIAGILVIINIFLPTVINLSVNWLGYFLMVVLSEILENKTASDMMSVFKEILEILLSMSVLFMVLLIFAMTVMIKTTQGV